MHDATGDTATGVSPESKLASDESSPGVLVITHPDGRQSATATHFVHAAGHAPPPVMTIRCPDGCKHRP